MAQVTVSSKYQVVIPEEIRARLNIRKGQKMITFDLNGIIELVPERDISEDYRPYLTQTESIVTPSIVVPERDQAR